MDLQLLSQRLRLLAPELDEARPLVPLYIENIHDLTSRPTARLYGCTSPNCDVFLRPFLPNWTGRGIGIILDVISIGVANRSVEATAVHEFGHALADDYIRQLQEPIGPAEVRAEIAMWQKYLSRGPSVASDSQTTESPYQGADAEHAEDFSRAVLHLRARAIRRYGWKLPIEQVGCYYPGHIARLKQGDLILAEYEYDRFADCPIGDILGTPAPAAFSAMFKSDNRASQPAASYEDYLVDWDKIKVRASTPKTRHVGRARRVFSVPKFF